MAPPLTRSEVASFRDQLAAMLTEIEAGRLGASTATRHRIEGASAALAAISGDREALIDLIGGDPGIGT